MKKPVRVALWVVAVLLVLTVAAVGVVALNVDRLAKTGIERAATDALGVRTTVDSAHVGLFSGTFTLGGLAIANPEGYKAPNFFHLGSGEVEASLATLNKPVVELPRLELRGLRADIERGLKGGNYQVILDNVKRTEDKPADAAAKKFIVREIVVQNINITVALHGVPGAASPEVNIPIHEIRLKNVGTAEGGMTAGQIAAAVVKAVMATAAERGEGLIPAAVLEDLRGRLANLKDLDKFGVEVAGKLGEPLQKLREGIGSITAPKEVKDAADKAIRKIEDLLPGRK